MAKKGVSVGVEITGSAKGFKSASEDAAKATAKLEREARARSREIERNFKMVTIAMAKIAAAVIVVKKGFEAYGKIMASTNTTGDKFAILQNKIKFSFDEVKRSIATADFEGLIKRLKEATKAGENFAKQLDLIGDLINQTSLIESELTLQMAQQELIYKNKKFSDEIRRAAAEKYLDVVKQLEAAQLTLAEAEVQAALASSSVVASGLSRERLEYYIRSASLLAENEDAVKSYLEAQKALEAGVRIGKYGEERGMVFKYKPEEIAAFKNEISGASDIIKDFAKDYENWQLAIDPERTGLTAALVKLNTALTESARNALKPLRTVASLLSEDKEIIENIAEGLERINEIIPKLSMPTAKILPELGLKDLQQYIPEMTNSLGIAEKAVESLSDSFEELFLNMGGGFKGMIKAMMDSIKLLIAQLAAKAAIFGILQLLFPGAPIAAKALTGLRSFVGVPGYAGGTNYALGGLSVVGERGPELVNLPKGSQVIPKMSFKHTFQFKDVKLKGNDLYFSVIRTAEMMERNT